VITVFSFIEETGAGLLTLKTADTEKKFKYLKAGPAEIKINSK